MKREKSLVPSRGRSPASVRLWTVLTAVAIVTTALFLSGCVTHKTGTTDNRVDRVITYAADSMAALARLDSQATMVLLKRQEPVKVPLSTVKLEIAADSLHRLPHGAAYTARKGQASVKVSKSEGGSPPLIIVEATCDSLQLVCEDLTLQLESEQRSSRAEVSGLKNRIAELEQQASRSYEKHTNGLKTWFDWLLAGWLLGVICATSAILLILRIRRKCTETEQT